MSVPIELQITETERLAILTALPLIAELSIPNPVNAELYAICAERSAEVLQSNQFLFSPDEIRTISIAISCAVLIFEGKTNEFISSVSDIDAWKRTLFRHYFALKKLDPILGHFCEVHLV